MKTYKIYRNNGGGITFEISYPIGRKQDGTLSFGRQKFFCHNDPALIEKRKKSLEKKGYVKITV